MSCNQCGDCCRLIALRADPEGVRASLVENLGRQTPVAWDKVATASFILEHWHPVDQARADTLYPAFAEVYRDSPMTFYVCDRFDEATNLCAAHEDRPPICRDFPWYGHEPGDHWLNPAYARCGYRQARTDFIALRRKDGEEVAGWGGG